MIKQKTAEGREAREFICAYIAHMLPAVTTRKQMIRAACVVFQVSDDWPQTRIEDGIDERCGAKVLRAIQQRPKELGLPTPPSLQKHTYLGNLKSAMGTLWARHNDPNHPEILALQWAVNQLEGRE